jgi:hypothetical protein
MNHRIKIYIPAFTFNLFNYAGVSKVLAANDSVLTPPEAA